ncbi:unnamed protein product, partial [Vitis vinifera]|uniref:Uncharacterized protein n=1 Tax=Vitis vinifera TaxID=29760 RepID=D7TV77_VITVI
MTRLLAWTVSVPNLTFGVLIFMTIRAKVSMTRQVPRGIPADSSQPFSFFSFVFPFFFFFHFFFFFFFLSFGSVFFLLLSWEPLGKELKAVG